jgi:hypothetical protein
MTLSMMIKLLKLCTGIARKIPEEVNGTTHISARYLVNPLNAELNPMCHFLALLGARHIFHVSGLRVNLWRYKEQSDPRPL